MGWLVGYPLSIVKLGQGRCWLGVGLTTVEVGKGREWWGRVGGKV